MNTIRIIKTWYGRRWAVVDQDGYTVTVKEKVIGESGQVVFVKENLLQFPYNQEGLKQARQALRELQS